MSTVVLTPDVFEAGTRVDPQAEAAMARWATSKPRQDLEEIPVAPIALAAPDCDPEPYDLRREHWNRLSLDEEQGEVGYR